MRDRFHGLLAGAAAGDSFPGGGRGFGIACAAARILCSSPDDERSFARFGTPHATAKAEVWRRFPRWIRGPDAASVVASLVAGAFHWRNPWLRTRFAVAAAPPPDDASGFSVAVACQAIARAAAIAMTGRSGDGPVASPAATDVGWTSAAMSRPSERPRFCEDTVRAADAWDDLADCVDGAMSTFHVSQAVNRAVRKRMMHGDVPAALSAWRRFPSDFPACLTTAYDLSTSGVGSALAGMLFGTRVGYGRISGFVEHGMIVDPRRKAIAGTLSEELAGSSTP